VRRSQNQEMERSDEQAAKNELTFREANEKIAARRGQLDTVAGPTPFICECEDPDCTELMQISLDDYRQVRADDGLFAVVPGHPTRGEETDLGGDGWVCVRK